MFKQSLIAGLLLLASLVAIPMSSPAQTLAVTNSLNWLTSTQTVDGNWPGVATEEFVATATATEALFLLNPAAPGYGQGVQWLEGQPASPTDLLARRIVALARAGHATSTEIAQLLAQRDGMGGWGGDDGYLLTSFDTALALQALKVVNHPDLSINIAALAWLTNAQNPDGGWGFTTDGSSSVAMTAVAASTLQQFPQTSTIATALNKAASYLLSHQNLDGGFGVDVSGAPASSIHETALASIALAGSGQGEWGPQQNALAFLATTQSANGSWNDDPYATALALKALYLAENQPAPPPPPSTTGSMIGTVVDAATGAPLAGVSAVVAGNPSLAASTDANGLFALSGLPNGAQQIVLTVAGYAPLTITVSITADTFINVGRIGLSVTPASGTIMGIVWDADENAPYPGVTVSATSSGSWFQSWQTVSGADGSFKLSGVTPGTVTVGTPSGPKTGYWNVPMTGPLASGGIMIYNPRMSKTHPPFVNMYMQADRAIYRKGESVALTVTIQNNRSIGYQALLKLRVTDPAGTSVFDKDMVVSLTAKGTLTQDASFVLPLAAQGGFYAAQAELYDASGEMIGSASASFGLLRSEIAVTPILPASFAAGVNTISFNLANRGTVAVASGVLDLALRSPDGEVLAAAAQDFSLAQGETSSLAIPVEIPALTFGTYTLTYTQRDETTDGTPVTLSLPNNVEIALLFDQATYRVGETANLLLTLDNTGQFSLDAATVHVAAGTVGFAETRNVSFGPGKALTLPYVLPLPDTMIAGEHTVTVTLALPGGASVTRNFTFTIPESALALSFPQTDYAAGTGIHPVIENSGGVETQVQYQLQLYDAQSKQIAEASGTETVSAGTTVSLALTIPDGAVEGDYNLAVNIKDLKTGKEQIIPNPITISGVKGSLQIRTDKQEYLSTEGITALSDIVNSGTALQGGNLHLQVSTAAGIEKQKTWTSQYDFQQGVRDGVDTYGVNDWLIPDDDFNGEKVDTAKWIYSVNSTLKSGNLLVDASKSWAGVESNWSLEGDFDIQVDFNSNNSTGSSGPHVSLYYQINGETVMWFFLKNSIQNGNEGVCVIYGNLCGSSTVGPYSQSGKFRFTRSGTTLTSYVWNLNSWTKILSITKAEFANNLRLEMSVNQPANATFDNFKISSGRIVTQNETVNSVRLLPLNDNFDDGVLNEDRWQKIGTIAPVETSGGLHLVSNAASGQNGAELRSRLPGDFRAVSRFKNYTASPANAIKGRFIMQAWSGNSGFYMNRHSYATSRAGGQFLVGISNINGQYMSGSDIPYTSSAGTFRLRREGTTGFTDYWDGSKWTTNHSRSGVSAGTASISFYTLSETNMPTVTVDVDSFNVEGGKYFASGTLKHKHDSGAANNKWAEVLYSATQPLGTSIKFRTRTADTEADLATAIWSDFITASGSPIPSPPGRWIEVEATLSTTDTNITPLLHDLTVTYGSDPGDILWQTDLPLNLGQGDAANLINNISALSDAGKYYLEGSVTSSTGQTVAAAESPFFVVKGNTTISIAPDKKFYKPGESVTISGEVKNFATIDAANLTLTLKTQPSGGTQQTLATETFTLPAGGSRPFSITTTAGAEGTVSLTAAVTQNGTTLAEIADLYQVASAVVSSTLTGPDVVAGDAPFDLLLALTNTGKTDATLSVGNSFNPVPESITVPAGATILRQYPQQITTDTLYTFTVAGDLEQTLTKSVACAAAPAGESASAKIVTDKVAYNPNEQVALISTVTAIDAAEHLTAWLRVTDGQGEEIHSESLSLAPLIQGQTLTFSRPWNTGTNPAGTYPVTLRIYSAAGTVIAQADCTLTISAPTTPKSLLRGVLSLDRQRILTGEPISVAYTLANVGNADLANINIAVKTIHAVDQTVYATITDQAALAKGASYTKSRQIDTLGYSARDYLVVLTANLAGVEETLAGTYFRVEGAPSAPALIGPGNGTDVASFTPALAVSNAADPNGDRLTYEFEIYAESGLTTLVASGTVAETAGSTLWNVSVPLTENQTYHWRVRAHDSRFFSPWMAPAFFRVNTVNDPPAAPHVSSPADGTSIAEFTPTLAVAAAADPDSLALVYHFVVASDPDFAEIVAEGRGVPATSWTIPVTLEENGWYYWRVRADDLLDEGPWSVTARFLVNTANDPPSAPVIVAPAGDSVLAALAADVVASNSADPDSPILSYYFEADTAATFDSANLLRSEAVAEGQETTLWRLSGLLDNTWYHLRAKASDGMAESPWSTVTGFFANTVNEPPTTPTLDNPSDGAGVNLVTPTLSVRNATDPDHDSLTYEFAVYDDAALTSLAAQADNIPELPQATTWTIPLALTENQTYYWHARSADGLLRSAWTAPASFMVNTANDAPGAPQRVAPAEGMSVETLTPALTVGNASDPDSDGLTYDFEVYGGGVLIGAVSGVPEGGDGTTSVTLGNPLTDDGSYTWRARAFDGDLYGQWMNMANFSVHIPKATIHAEIEFAPETLNRRDQGRWVNVVIGLPDGYKASDIDLSSIRLEGTLPVEPRPISIQRGEHGEELTVKFKRSQVISVLPVGKDVPVHVTGMVGTTAFEGVDLIRVID